MESQANHEESPKRFTFTRRNLTTASAAAVLSVTGVVPSVSSAETTLQPPEAASRPKFTRMDNGLRLLTLREGVPNGKSPAPGDQVKTQLAPPHVVDPLLSPCVADKDNLLGGVLQVEVHYYGRLAAKQGWTFGSSYKDLVGRTGRPGFGQPCLRHVFGVRKYLGRNFEFFRGGVAYQGLNGRVEPLLQDKFGSPVPFKFTVGDAGVIEGLNLAVQRMTTGMSMRVVIPGPLGYQNKAQQPVPKEVRALVPIMSHLSATGLLFCHMRVVIPGPLGYQNEAQQPVPKEVRALVPNK
eukprot:446943-Prorocentrum_minimum.AAC.4